MADGRSFADVLERVIDDGIAAARSDYVEESDRPRLEGSVAGFEACRGKTPTELRTLLEAAKDESWKRKRSEQDPENVWWARCYELEVEWTCNVMSAALMNSGLPIIVTPTIRGVRKAADILGVADAPQGD